jgi:hypothetical protein
MSFLKKAILAVCAAILGTLIAGGVGFLNEVHLEISFDKLKDFNPTDLASYAKLGAGMRVDVETAKDQDYVAYWMDDDNGKPQVRSSKISYKDYGIRSRIVGKLVDDDGAEYVMTGYYNSNRLLFVNRGTQSGTGTYILDHTQLDGINGNAYAGYGIFEDVNTGSPVIHILKCPFIMIAEPDASIKFPSIDAATRAFPFLRVACKEFPMPKSITTAEK